LKNGSIGSIIRRQKEEIKMLRTYKAIMSSNRLKWMEEEPMTINEEKDIFVYVTILDKDVQAQKIQRENKNTLIDFFENSPLYNSGIDLERNKDFGREVRF
jgi:hypothetical protein